VPKSVAEHILKVVPRVSLRGTTVPIALAHPRDPKARDRKLRKPDKQRKKKPDKRRRSPKAALKRKKKRKEK
jgi:hypothetical protein